VSATVPTLSHLFRPTLDPERILRHNRAIGSRLQQAVTRVFMVYLVGSLVALGLRLFFRLRVVHLVPLRDLAHDQVLFAGRHFYEWDPTITLTALAWKEALMRPALLPYIVAGDFWFRTPPLRALLWLMNILCLVRDHEPDHGALARVTGLFRREAKASALIFPTGPIGQSQRYRVKPGIGWMAEECPDAQIVPVTTMGLQELRLRDVLLLRRPRLTLVSGTPFRGREVEGADRHERERVVCERVHQQWQEMEHWVRETDMRADRVPMMGPRHTIAPCAPAHRG
jgi:1-acyl-sn-glycerol-3-phosphate acyltransferase